MCLRQPIERRDDLVTLIEKTVIFHRYRFVMVISIVDQIDADRPTVTGGAITDRDSE